MDRKLGLCAYRFLSLGTEMRFSYFGSVLTSDKRKNSYYHCVHILASTLKTTIEQ